MLDAIVRDSLAQVMKLGSARLDPRRTFGSMGLSSLMAIELRNRLEAALGQPLSATLAWNHPTIEALVDHLAGRDESSAPASESVSAAPVIETAGVAEVAAMSDEHALRSLKRRGGGP
jgi:myxalamid-type polyketide synthase MxaE and MxaD